MTAIKVPLPLWVNAKRHAAETRTTLQQIVTDALIAYLPKKDAA